MRAAMYGVASAMQVFLAICYVGSAWNHEPVFSGDPEQVGIVMTGAAGLCLLTSFLLASAS